MHVQFNPYAVVAAGFLNFFIGFIWYSLGPIKKEWMAFYDLKEEDTKKGIVKPILIFLIGSFVAAFMLAWFVGISKAATFLDGALVGLSIWVGFILITYASDYAFARKPWRMLLVSTGALMISLFAQAGLLAVWK